jgi:hypothetical protein
LSVNAPKLLLLNSTQLECYAMPSECT